MMNNENIDSNRQNKQPFPLIDEDVRIVLSFDGGGIRGLISVIIAAAIEKAAGVPLSSGCDLLIGTSIGGITALLLATPDEQHGHKPKFKATDISHHYRDLAKRVFSIPLSRALKTLWGFDKSKYNNHNIKKIMEEYFKDVRLSQALTPTMVVGAEIERYIPLLFKSYEDPDFFMKDAAQATSAAPTFFPVAKIKSISPSNESPLSTDEKNENYYVIDGKLTGANNPAILGYIEACHLYNTIKEIKDKVLVISIGTGKTHGTIHYDEVAEAGFLGWMPFIFPLLGELENDLTDYQMNLLLKDIPTTTAGTLRRYWRLQPNIPEELLMLDAFSEKKLTDIENIAKNYILEHKREINTIGALLSHRARYLKNSKI
jgi:hypothetical protein